LLKCIHDAVRGVRSELDLASTLPGAASSRIRSEVSSALRMEIESTPGHVRRLLRPRSAANPASAAGLDPGDVAETEALIELVEACRHYASELAVSEVTLRAYSELPAISRHRNAFIVRGSAWRRSGRPAVSTVAGRRRGAVLRQGLRSAICCVAWPGSRGGRQQRAKGSREGMNGGLPFASPHDIWFGHIPTGPGFDEYARFPMSRRKRRLSRCAGRRA